MFCHNHGIGSDIPQLSPNQHSGSRTTQFIIEMKPQVLMYLNANHHLESLYNPVSAIKSLLILITTVVCSFIFVRRTIMEDGTLRITNISKSDGGRYTCVARNPFGTSSSTGTLVVKGTFPDTDFTTL